MQNEQAIAKPSLLMQVAKEPHLFSVICKSRLFYSRHFTVRPERADYRREKHLFTMSPFETERYDELRKQGFTVLHDFFDVSRIDFIYEKADRLFRDLQIDTGTGYSVEKKRRQSLEGLTYQELESSEKFVCLKDSLLNVPECIEMIFNESILKIVANFLRYIPPRYRPLIVRDFPLDRPRESSNFHKDNNDCDTVQVFVYLVDIDDTRGPLIYVPGTHRYDVRSCRPKENRDLGLDDNDGRVSDSTIEKYYPPETWATLKVKRGSVVIIHGNGFHKGPSWPTYGDPRNRARTTIRVDAHGNSATTTYRGGGEKIKREDYDGLSKLQKLFAKWCAVVD
jgi:Phytanoyl-CoA dioxygenase (PhyH)